MQSTLQRKRFDDLEIEVEKYVLITANFFFFFFVFFFMLLLVFFFFLCISLMDYNTLFCYILILQLPF